MPESSNTEAVFYSSLFMLVRRIRVFFHPDTNIPYYGFVFYSTDLVGYHDKFVVDHDGSGFPAWYAGWGVIPVEKTRLCSSITQYLPRLYKRPSKVKYPVQPDRLPTPRLPITIVDDRQQKMLLFRDRRHARTGDSYRKFDAPRPCPGQSLSEEIYGLMENARNHKVVSEDRGMWLLKEPTEREDYYYYKETR
ncbi:hypothetical protein SISNIDRAFT_316848 [Sistotremastrum niveocremeum HHB9708]|uniref:Uncharacterized protein n=1 Tax=Sistotremastrum niveocremeum HHB9708 TaxID=1314777 RepID=A0A164Y1A8_9AGAM|nr:hypothetical protein SISNIDRAFT_316848 [Sistotremastrum niveocremeum HHB9708]